MSNHYNLYEVLNLQDSESPETLDAKLGELIGQTPEHGEPGRITMLHTAKDILGNPSRKRAYDAALANPTGPTVDVPALMQLAKTAPEDLDRQGQPQNSQTQPVALPQSQLQWSPQSGAQQAVYSQWLNPQQGPTQNQQLVNVDMIRGFINNNGQVSMSDAYGAGAPQRFQSKAWLAGLLIAFIGTVFFCVGWFQNMSDSQDTSGLEDLGTISRDIAEFGKLIGLLEGSSFVFLLLCWIISVLTLNEFVWALRQHLAWRKNPKGSAQH